MSTRLAVAITLFAVMEFAILYWVVRTLAF